MPQIVELILDGEGVMYKFDQTTRENPRQGVGNIIVSSLVDGMESGKPSVAIISEMDDGNLVILQMGLAMLQTVNAGLRGRYGIIDKVDGDMCPNCHGMGVELT